MDLSAAVCLWKATARAYQADELDIALRELRLELGEGAELSGASRGEVVGVGEEYAVRVANELVEVDLALGGDGLEVGRLRAETKARGDWCQRCN